MQLTADAATSRLCGVTKNFPKSLPKQISGMDNSPIRSTKPNEAVGTTAVKTYPANPYGLYDLSGNVWEWCSDLYNANYYAEESKKGTSKDPQGPTTSFDPEEPHASKHVHRGGSFLCHASYCKGYRITARMKTCPDTGLNHLGFRCVKDKEDDIAGR